MGILQNGVPAARDFAKWGTIYYLQNGVLPINFAEWGTFHYLQNGVPCCFAKWGTIHEITAMTVCVVICGVN